MPKPQPDRFKAYIMSGIPGSGKTTYIQRNFKDLCPEAWCSADLAHMRGGKYVFDPTKARDAHHWCLRKFIRACQDGYSPVVCDNTNTTVAAIAPYVAVAQAHGYKTEIIAFETSVEDSIRRNIHNVPEETIRKMHAEQQFLLHGQPSIPPWWKVTVHDWKANP